MFLDFDDAENESDWKGCVPIKERHIEKIIKFIKKYEKEKLDIIVHCHAGISRSSAIAAAISLYLNKNCDDIFSNYLHAPNNRCFKMVCEGFNIGISGIEFNRLIDLNKKAYKERYKDGLDDLFI